MPGEPFVCVVCEREIEMRWDAGLEVQRIVVRPDGVVVETAEESDRRRGRAKPVVEEEVIPL